MALHSEMPLVLGTNDSRKRENLGPDIEDTLEELERHDLKGAIEELKRYGTVEKYRLLGYPQPPGQRDEKYD